MNDDFELTPPRSPHSAWSSNSYNRANSSQRHKFVLRNGADELAKQNNLKPEPLLVAKYAELLGQQSSADYELAGRYVANFTRTVLNQHIISDSPMLSTIEHNMADVLALHNGKYLNERLCSDKSFTELAIGILSILKKISQKNIVFSFSSKKNRNPSISFFAKESNTEGKFLLSLESAYGPNNYNLIHCVNNQEFIDYISSIATLPSHVKSSGMATISLVETTSKGDLTSSTHYIPLENLRLPHDSFYPVLENGVTKFLQEYLDADENALILYGPAGTGKTTLCRGFNLFDGHVMFVADVQTASNPDLYSFFDKSPANILIVEEADNALKPKKDGNAIMSVILNKTDGFIPTYGKKIVFCANLSELEEIDANLTRPGRTYATIKLNYLNTEQAAKVLEVTGKTKDISVKNNWTLGELLSEQKQL